MNGGTSRLFFSNAHFFVGVQFCSFPFTRWIASLSRETDMEPITVKPQVAFTALGVGKTKGWELIARGDLKSLKIDGVTLVTTESVKALVQRKLEAEAA